MASSPSQENRIPTQTFLLPGQQFCVGLPWEREALPKHGLPPALPKPPKARGTTLDEDDALVGDPCAGWTIGRCEILRRLSPGSARRLLALRRDDGDTAVVDVRKLELEDALAPEIEVLAAAAARFSHPHLARVYPAEVSEEGLFWVSERVSGASLSELAAACRANGKGLPVGLALSAVYESAMGLGEVHGRGQGHGLLSDQSVAVGFDGLTRVLDVGLFRCLARRASWAEVLDITGPYLSPEQVLRGHMPDAKCDVFSLGILLYEGLTGERVRRTERFEDRVKMHERPLAPPSSLNVMLPREVDAVVFRALEADRAKRYASGPDLALALREAAGSFLWKPERRAEFVAELFATRRRHEQALTAHVAKRRATQPRHVAVELPVAPPIPLVTRVPVPVPSAPRKKSRRKAAPRTRAEVVALGAGFAAAFLLALVPAASLATAVALRLEPRAAPAVVLAPAAVHPVVVATPAPVDALVSVEPPLAPAVSLGATWWSDDALLRPAATTDEVASPSPAAPAKKKPGKVRAKKKRDDAPLPPWLSGR